MPRPVLFGFLATAVALAACGSTSSSGEVGADGGGPGAGDASAADTASPDTFAGDAFAADASSSDDASTDAFYTDSFSPTPADGSAVDSAQPPGSDGSVPPGDGGGACPTPPSGGLYATFTDGADVFHASITNASGIADALALWHGTSTAKIPNGKLLCTPAAFNCPWHWQIDPASIGFADTTIELCDGTPSYVEANCPSFGGGAYCPWSATMTELRDCRTDPSCPAIPK